MSRNFFTNFTKNLIIILAFSFLTSCGDQQSIVNNVREREANEIIVFLASKGVDAQKARMPSQGGAAATEEVLWSITVPSNKAVQAMALLNQQGIPKKAGTTLLQLFAKSGLMSSDREENIRYQAGLEEELKNVILKIDGIIDANVQISFPTTEIIPGAAPPRAKAAVYIKHLGVFDEPNNHLETKIKKLISGSIENLSFEDVAIIPDKAHISSISLTPEADIISANDKSKEYVSIWSIIMTKNSAGKFRSIFFILISVVFAFGGVIGWLIYKYYPLMRKSKEK